MTHPIFRPGRFPMWRAEARTLYRRLTEQFSRQQDVQRLYRSCGEGLPELFLGQAVDLVWQEALDALAARNLLRQLTELITTEGPGAVLAAAITAVTEAQPLVNEVVSAEDVLVINRGNLRALLGQLASNTHPTKVVLVRGKPKSGKTHGQYLFELAARDEDAEAVYLGAGMVATVEETVRWLFSVVFGLTEEKDIPVRDSTPDAWYRAVSIRLITLAKARGRPVWIAVDDLGPDQDGIPLMDEQILAFFKQLAVQLQSQATRSWFRLMLIHYPDGPLPTGWRRDLSGEDRLDEADIGKADIVAKIELWATGRDRAQLTAEHLDELAEQVLAAAGAPPPERASEPRLQIIHDVLAEKLRELEGASS